MAGWIKLHRSITDNPLWSAEPFTKGQAWVDLMLSANFTDNDIIIKGQLIKLKRGQQARSELTLSKQWKWSRNKVRRFLELLKKQGMIESETNHLTSIITICNYCNYQSGDTTNGTPNETTGGTPDGHLTIHSKEGNKENKVINYTTKHFKEALLSAGAESVYVDTWLAIRKKKKATNSEIALNSFMKQIHLSNLTINQCLQMACENSWSGFKAEWIQGQQSKPNQQPSFLEGHADSSWALGLINEEELK